MGKKRLTAIQLVGVRVVEACADAGVNDTVARSIYDEVRKMAQEDGFATRGESERRLLDMIQSKADIGVSDSRAFATKLSREIIKILLNDFKLRRKLAKEFKDRWSARAVV